jgi:hypothetical protein
MNKVTIASLLDELVKIGAASSKEEQNIKNPPHESQHQPAWKPILRTAVATGLGSLAGSYLAEKTAPHIVNLLPHAEGGKKALKIILPIMGAAASYMNSRLEARKQDELEKIRGYKRPQRR